MKCPECEADNKIEAKFCRNCGRKMHFICPNCSTENLPWDNFCDHCGFNLTLPEEQVSENLSIDEKLAKLKQHLPKGMTEKILAQKDRIQGQTMQVSVMLCQLEGFSSFSDRFDPEETYAVMDQIYEVLIHHVRDCGGTVNEMTDDGITALFGAPITLEDAPGAVVSCSLTIHKKMARMIEKLRQDRKGVPALRMRIGVHTGPVVIGKVGNDLRVEFEASEDTVDLASRVAGLADAGMTYVSDDTFKASQKLFRFEALGPKEVKGKEEPITVFRVIVPYSRGTRFDVSSEAGLTPFVARERELELLIDGFQRCKSGRGQAFSVISEAGMGKSRLLYEFRKALANEDATFLESRCLSYTRGLTYHPVLEIVKANFGIMEDDGEFEIRYKLKRGLDFINADEGDTLVELLQFLSVEEEGPEVDRVSLRPEVKKDKILSVLNNITIKGSTVRPLIMVVEDLHWIDQRSEDYFEDLVDKIAQARVLLIFTCRPGFHHPWKEAGHHSQVNLNRLSRRESLAMIRQLMDAKEIVRVLEEFILEKTQGVPFFIEEFIKTLKHLEIIEKKGNQYLFTRNLQKITIPSSIKGVIMARVALLAPAARQVLQAASVIGREFDYKLIEQILGLSESEILPHLSSLKNEGFLNESRIYPGATHLFRHTLTLEAIYDSVSTAEKKGLHGEIGRAMEKLNKGANLLWNKELSTADGQKR